MSGRKIVVKGFRLDKSGKIVRNKARLDVSTRLRQAASKRGFPDLGVDKASLLPYIKTGN